VRARTPEGVPRGVFMTLEGIEGSGKSTHARRLHEALRARGFVAFLTREPGGTPLGESLRALLLGVDGDLPSPEAELYLMLAARAQHVRRVILPRLAAGEVVISDRFSDASLAYQGGGRGLGVDRVRALAEAATSGLVPDRTVLVDAPLEEALVRVGRRRDRGEGLDRFDREERAFHARVQETYRSLAEAEPDRWIVASSSEAVDAVAAVILAAIEPLLEDRRARGALA